MFSDGLLLSTIRGLHRISQAELHRLSGVPHPYISHFENDQMTLKPRHIQALETALGVKFETVRPAFQEFAQAVLADSNGHPATRSNGQPAAGDGDKEVT